MVTNRGTGQETRMDASLCEYDNVLCLEYEELMFSWERGNENDNSSVENVANNLTNKFRKRFEYFFGTNSEFLNEEKVAASIRRLEGMARVGASLANQPYSESDQKYGVHGGHNPDGVSRSFRGKLYYCGGAQGKILLRSFWHNLLPPSVAHTVSFRTSKRAEKFQLFRELHPLRGSDHSLLLP